MFHVPSSMRHVPFYMFQSPYSMCVCCRSIFHGPHVHFNFPHAVFKVPCSMFHVQCSVVIFHVQCSKLQYMYMTNMQCSGSMTFWGGSGSGSSDTCFWLIDPDPAILVIDLQRASKKLIFNLIFSAYYFLKVHIHHFSKIKSQKESQNIRNQGFSYYFCMMIEGSGSGSGSGSVPLTSGSGSGSWRPKNMWIRWIRNTAHMYTYMYFSALGLPPLCSCMKMMCVKGADAIIPVVWSGQRMVRWL